MTAVEKFTRDKMTDIEAIRAWYKDPEGFGELSEHQKEKRSRLLLIQSMSIDGHSDNEICCVLQADYNMSISQCYRDIKQAIRLYGEIKKADKEGMRWIMYGMALEIKNKALHAGNLKQANAAMANMIKITGVDKEDPELPDFGKLAPSINLIILSEGTEDRLNALLSGGVVNFSQMRKEQAANIKITEHEDLTGATD